MKSRRRPNRLFHSQRASVGSRHEDRVCSQHLSHHAHSLSAKFVIAILTISGAGFLYFATPGFSQTNANGQIDDIVAFMDRCPKNNPFYQQIKNDFHFYFNGARLDFDSIPCYEPMSSIPDSNYSSPLVFLKALEVIHDMDSGMSRHLPWAHSSLYDWLKQSVGGISIRDGLSNSYCCDTFEGRPYVVLDNISTSKMMGTDWKWLSEIAGVIAHEARHSNSTKYNHVNCNGELIDQDYDVNDLSAYGVQHWLYLLWYDGTVNVGSSCLSPDKVAEINKSYFDAATGYGNLFCGAKAPPVSPVAQPGGYCKGGSVAGCLFDSFGFPLKFVGVDALGSISLDGFNNNVVLMSDLSQDNGSFVLERLVGSYDVSFDPDECFAPKEVGLSLLDGQSLPLNVTLDDKVVPAPSVSVASAKKGLPALVSAQRGNPTATNPVLYYFDFGDGSNSGWLSNNSTSHAWPNTGNYTVSSKTRCAYHNIESLPANYQLNVLPPDGPDLSATIVNPIIQTCTKNARKATTQCILKSSANPSLQVQNVGNQESYSSSVSFYLSDDDAFSPDDQFLKKSAIPRKKPGQSQNINFSQYKLPLNANASGKYVIAVVDSPYDVNPANNYVVFKIE
jgi:hypothetical protein